MISAHNNIMYPVFDTFVSVQSMSFTATMWTVHESAKCDRTVSAAQTKHVLDLLKDTLR